MPHVHTRPENDDCSADPTAVGALSRRHLLGAVATGFALAGSGLLLPEWLGEEAAAADHPVRRVQGRRDQQRKKRRHWREHRREVQRRDNGTDRKSAPRGGGPWDVSFYVYNDNPVTSPNGSATIQPFYMIGGDRNGNLQWEPGDEGRIANGTWIGKFTHQNCHYAGIVINNDFFISVENPAVWWPVVSVRHGGSVTENGYKGGSFLLEPKGLSEQEQVEAFGGGYQFTMKRLYDIDQSNVKAKVFDFRFRKL